MRNSQAKRNIFLNIQKGLKTKTDRPYPSIPEDTLLIEPTEDDLAVTFAQQFDASGGNYIYCENTSHFFKQLNEFAEGMGWDYIYTWEDELYEPLSKAGMRQVRKGKQLDLAHASLTTCEALIADSGSILFTSSQNDQHRLMVEPPVQIVIAYYSQLLINMEEAIDHLAIRYGNQLPSYVEFVNGPCQTRALEMERVKGGMGPNEIYLFFIDDAAMIPQLIEDSQRQENEIASLNY